MKQMKIKTNQCRLLFLSLLLAFGSFTKPLVAQDAGLIILDNKQRDLRKAFADAKRFAKQFELNERIRKLNEYRTNYMKARSTIKNIKDIGKYFDVNTYQELVRCVGFRPSDVNTGIDWSLCSDLNTFQKAVLDSRSIEGEQVEIGLTAAREARKMSELYRRLSADFLQKANMPGFTNAERINLLKASTDMRKKAMELSKQSKMPELRYLRRQKERETDKLEKNLSVHSQVKAAYKRMSIRR